MKFNFVKNQKVFFAISLVLVVATIVSILTVGFNLDIEFVGGTELTFKLDQNATKDDEQKIENAVVEIIGKDNFSSVRVANGNEVVVRTMLVDKETDYNALNTEIGNRITALYPEAEFVSASEGAVVYNIPVEEAAEEVVEETVEEVVEETAEVVEETAEVAEETAEVAEETAEVAEETAEVAEETAEVAEEVAEVAEETAEVAEETVEVAEETAEVAEETAEVAEETAEVVEEVAEETVEEVDPATAIEEALNDGTIALHSVVVTENEGAYTVEYAPSSEVNLLRSEIEEKINELYPIADGSADDTRLTGMSTVSAEVSDSLKKTAVSATALAIILMLVYIAFRFEGRASIAAVVCLAHDIIVMLLAYVVFQVPVSSTVIAAILTILGYSINATIVIFDRIRENNKQMHGVSFEDKVDSGIKSTLWRSLNTTITTLITIGLIYFMGVTSIKNFALPLIVGIISGVYSSVCLSGNVWVALKKIGK